MDPSTQFETDRLVAHLFREQAGRIVASLTRVFGSHHLDLAEDVVQDALVKALQQWPFNGVPPNPVGWLTLVAKNAALDRIRRVATLADKAAELESAFPTVADRSNELSRKSIDDHLALILMCSHPALAVEYQLALTLKLASGLSTAEIARAFLTPKSTIAQRLVRAKRQIREGGIRIEPPDEADLARRIDGVLRVVYLVFNEGYGATAGENLVRGDLCDEAIRLGQLLLHYRVQLPSVHALLALMMLQAARLPARTHEDGTLAVLAHQDRSLWDRRLIGEGMRHLGRSAEGNVITTYHLQAEIAAIHATAESDDATNWAEVVRVYDQLYGLEPTPVVALNRAIACSRWRGPQAGIEALNEINVSPAMSHYHLLPAVRGELFRQLGDHSAAARSYGEALACSCTEPERRFLEGQLALVLDCGIVRTREEISTPSCSTRSTSHG